MPKSRYANRIDSNQPKIVADLRERGYSVQVGMDDIVVGFEGRTYWYEIKTGPKASIKPSQTKLLDEWKGHYKIVWSTEMIISDIEGSK